MTKGAKKIVTTLLSAALLAAGPAVVYAAQPSSQSSQATQAAKAPKHYSQQQLNNFVAAFHDIKGIQQHLTQQLKGVKNKKHAQQMQQAAMQKMVKAVQSHHLSPNTYNSIAIHARRDPKLRARIMKMIHASK